jgi:ABC-type sugar transport system substrate-binding protein
MRTHPFSTSRLMAVTLSASLLLAACGSDNGDNSGGGSDSADTGTAAEGSTSVGAVIKGLDNPFFQAMEDGIEAGAADLGVEAEVQAAADIADTTGQGERLSAMAGQGFDCFIVNPISATNLLQGMTQIPDGTPVVNIDLPVEAAAAQEAGVEIATYIGTRNESAGQLAGEHMLELVGGEGQVGIIGGIAGDVTSAARIDGFTAAVEGQLELVGPVAADWQRERALTAATDMIQANPDLVGFFAANDDMGLGIARAIANAGRTGEIEVISVDGNQNALEAVEAGELSATVAQYPYAIGELGVQACQIAIEGGDLPENVEAPVALVTADVAPEAIESFPAPFQEFENPLDELEQ